MSENNNYGKNNKRIIFTDTDHRHAQLSLKLKNDGMTQAKFFRSIISGYLSDDERIRSYVVENGDLSKEKRSEFFIFLRAPDSICLTRAKEIFNLSPISLKVMRPFL